MNDRASSQARRAAKTLLAAGQAQLLAMRLHLVLLALGAARALWLPAVRPPVRLRAASAVCSADDDPWDEELDAMDTTSSWDEEIAAMEAWKAGKSASPDWSGEQAGHVDEDAHYGFEDPEDPDAMRQRQLSEKNAALELLARAAGGGAPPEAEPGNARVLTALDSVLRSMMRLEERLGAIEKKMDGMLAAGGAAPTAADTAPTAADAASPSAPAPPPSAAPADDDAPKAEEWNGEVDEAAWFDVDADEEELGDWRDVRKLKKLFESDDGKGVD